MMMMMMMMMMMSSDLDCVAVELMAAEFADMGLTFQFRILIACTYPENFKVS